MSSNVCIPINLEGKEPQDGHRPALARCEESGGVGQANEQTCTGIDSQRLPRPPLLETCGTQSHKVKSTSGKDWRSGSAVQHACMSGCKRGNTSTFIGYGGRGAILKEDPSTQLTFSIDRTCLASSECTACGETTEADTLGTLWCAR